MSEDLQLSYTMDPEQIKYPYHVTLLTTSVNRAIPSFIPEILDESTLAINETLGLSDPSSPGMLLPHLPPFFPHNVFQSPFLSQYLIL